MVESTKAKFLMVKHMGKENLAGNMGHIMKDSLSEGVERGKGQWLLKMEQSIREPGLMDNVRDMEKWPGQMVPYMKENG